MIFSPKVPPTHQLEITKEMIVGDDVFEEDLRSLNPKERDLNDFLETLSDYVMENPTPLFKVVLYYVSYTMAKIPFLLIPILLCYFLSQTNHLSLIF